MRPKNLKFLISALANLAFGTIALGQLHYGFENLSTDKGLSNGRVTMIRQDDKGFLWIGTNAGLDRFDGYRFKHFLSHGLNSFYIEKSGKLCLLSDQGLELFDPATETLVSFTRQIDSLELSRQMMRLTEDKNGNYWITSIEFHENKGGLIFFDTSTRQFKKFDDGSMTNTGPVLIDESGNIWAGAQGISILNPTTGKFIKHFDSEGKKTNGLQGDAIYGLYQEKDGVIWAATNEGLSRIAYSKDYAIDIETFKKNPLNTNSLVHNTTTGIIKDNKGYFWISTVDGISRFDFPKREFMNFVASNASADALKESNANIIYQDKNGNIWIGHSNLGLSKIKNNKGFLHLSTEPDRKASLTGTNTSHVYADRNGIIWLGIVDRGVYSIDFRGDYTRYPVITNYPSPNRWVSAMVRDANNNLWVGGWPDGELYQYKKGMSVSGIAMNFSNVISLGTDRKNNLWILDQVRGLYKSGKQQSFVNLLPDPQLKSKHITLNFSDMTKDRIGRLWVTNWEGEIYCLDTLSQKFYKPEIKSSSSSNHSEAAISTVKATLDNHLWVGTLQGLHKYKIENDPQGRATLMLDKIFAEKEGLARDGKPNLYTATLEEDLHGNLWLAQNSGLYKLDPIKNTLKLYAAEDGLPGNTFPIRGSCQLTNGFLAFGTTNGLAIFHPDSLRENLIPPHIVFTEFQLSNQPVSVVPDSSKNFHLGQAAPYTKEVIIPYDENVLGFEFAALDFTATEKNQYAYQMVGFDNQWVYSGTRRSATYTNLNPGTYTFKVKGSNNDGYWNESGTVMSIVILPPPWKTWWAYSLYGAGLVGLLFVARKEIVKRERLRNQFKLKELEASKYYELDTLKSRFFSNISHEFRTPLTLILGPLQKRLEMATSKDDQTELSIMQRNASRLLNLVNQLLDLSRLEAGMLKLKCVAADLKEFVTAVASQFSSIASSKQINFRISQSEDIVLYFDSDKLNKIISNLLSNAFKFTPEGGSIEVIITKGNATSHFKEGFAEIVMVDSGLGIKQEHIDKIFDRFYQADNSATREYEGSGIGLALTKELVELHQGEISVRSVAGEGSVFTIRLPLGKSHLATDEFAEQQDWDTKPFLENLPLPSFESTSEIEIDKQGDLLPYILIVEDNDDLRYYLRENLKQNYNVLDAEDGEKGIAVAIEELPDLIVSDLMMPKVSGLQLCQRLKEDERTSHIPIILLTAKADVGSRIAGLQTGADDYIAKPFDVHELKTRIRNLIAIRTKLQEKFSKQLYLRPAEIKVESIDDRFMKKIIALVEAKMSDSSFGVDQLAVDAAMSSIQLYRKLKALTGHGPNDFIRNFRLERAASLLQQQAGTVADIAYQVGFNSLSYFSKCFKDKFEKAPSEFQKDVL